MPFTFLVDYFVYSFRLTRALWALIAVLLISFKSISWSRATHSYIRFCFMDIIRKGSRDATESVKLIAGGVICSRSAHISTILHNTYRYRIGTGLK